MCWLPAGIQLAIEHAIEARCVHSRGFERHHLLQLLWRFFADLREYYPLVDGVTCDHLSDVLDFLLLPLNHRPFVQLLVVFQSQQ